jgi:hypothetical protein
LSSKKLKNYKKVHFLLDRSVRRVIIEGIPDGGIDL